MIKIMLMLNQDNIVVEYNKDDIPLKSYLW